MADIIRLPDELGAQIRQQREALGLNKSELAAKAGKVREVVYRLEAGEDTTVSSLLAVLGALGLSLRLEKAGLPTAAEQVAMLEVVIAKAWTVRQTEDAVRRWVVDNGRVSRPDRQQRDAGVARVEDRLQRALGTRVAVKREGAGEAGTVTIHFHSEEELHALFDRIVGEELW